MSQSINIQQWTLVTVDINQMWLFHTAVWVSQSGQWQNSILCIKTANSAFALNFTWGWDFNYKYEKPCDMSGSQTNKYKDMSLFILYFSSFHLFLTSLYFIFLPFLFCSLHCWSPVSPHKCCFLPSLHVRNTSIIPKY